MFNGFVYHNGEWQCRFIQAAPDNSYVFTKDRIHAKHCIDGGVDITAFAQHTETKEPLVVYEAASGSWAQRAAAFEAATAPAPLA